MDSYLKTSTILYVEDDHEVRLGYSKALSRIAKTLYTANDGEEGLRLFNEYTPDIVITDLKMPHKSGIEMSKEIGKINSGNPIGISPIVVILKSIKIER